MKRLALLVVMALLPTSVYAVCQGDTPLPDLNCDGVTTVVVLGDSLVAGFGDIANRNQGGYVLRTQERFPSARIIGHGFLGIRTRPLLKRIKQALAGSNFASMGVDLVAADLIILDLGRNDRWLFGTPLATLRNLQRIRTTLDTEVHKRRDSSPIIVQPALMLPNRGSQGPWVRELNDLILKAHSKQFPCDLRFDRVSKRLLADDNIHPTSKGYVALAKTFTKYLRLKYPRHAARR